MGKISVKEIAAKMNVNEANAITRLKQIGINVKNGLDMVDSSVLSKLKNDMESPHIVRRKVKVVTTDDSGNEVEKITTNSGGNVQKTKIVHSNGYNNGYSKEGLGIVKSNRRQNAMSNIVVTKNGQKVETPTVKKETIEEKKLEKEIGNLNSDSNQSQTQPSLSVDKQKNQQVELSNVGKRNFQDNNNGNSQEQNYTKQDDRGYQRRDGYSNNYNNNYNNNRRPYENRNNNNDNKDNKTSFNRDGRQGYNRDNNGYNRDNNGYRNNTYNRNYGDRNNTNSNNNNNNSRSNSFQDRRPGQYNNNNNARQGQYNNNTRPPYNNQNGRNNNDNGFRRDYSQNRPGFNNNQRTDYKVTKFIKSTTADTIQKETRDYSTTLIDKKKYNEEKNQVENKREKKNVNTIREQDTRVDFNKIRGMQVSEDGLMELYDRGESRGYSKRRKQKIVLNTTKIIPLTEVELPDAMSVKYFAECIKKQASEVIKKLFGLGVMATINKEIDFDTAYLIAQDFGITAKKQLVVTEEDKLFDDTEDEEDILVSRPPIVTIMGHVDHGKTSLLDKIRESKIALGEFGGITQHIGAYKVEVNNREITFLDTPGHEAFSAMRARGAQVTDIIIIVVAADDSIKPQTVEAINHAKAANVPIIVAINKIDKPEANIEKVKQDLMEYDLVAEEWGGDTICVPVSAKTGDGIDTLLEMILLVADVKDLKVNPNKQAKGTVIEAKLDKTKGAIASVIVQRGTLNVGDTIVLGDIVGRVRVMKDDKGQKIIAAGPSTPVEILGLGVVPETGDVFYEVKDEKTAHKLIEKRKAAQRADLIKQGSTVTLDDLFSKIKDGELKNLDIVLRADVQGSVQALKDSLEKLSNDEVRVRVIAKNTGGITESDVTLAKLSNAIIIGFNVKADSNVLNVADREHVDLRLYTVIYDAIKEVEVAMKGMLKPNYVEEIVGTAEVRHLFKVSSIGTIAGSYVKSGKIVRNGFARVIRNSNVIDTAKIESLKRDKDDVKEVASGFECGIKLEKFNDILEGDMLECYIMVEKARS